MTLLACCNRQHTCTLRREREWEKQAQDNEGRKEGRKKVGSGWVGLDWAEIGEGRTWLWVWEREGGLSKGGKEEDEGEGGGW